MKVASRSQVAKNHTVHEAREMAQTPPAESGLKVRGHSQRLVRVVIIKSSIFNTQRSLGINDASRVAAHVHSNKLSWQHHVASYGNFDQGKNWEGLPLPVEYLDIADRLSLDTMRAVSRYKRSS